MQEGTSTATCVATKQLAEMVKCDVAGRAGDPFVPGVPTCDASQMAEEEGKWAC